MSEDFKNENIEEKEEVVAEAAEKEETAAEVTGEKEVGKAAETKAEESPRRSDSRPQRSDDDNKRFQKIPRFKKKVCRFCHNKDIVIDYKKSDILAKFITDRGKILPRRVTGTCAKHQRLVATEIKRARIIALLPFVEQ